jgi:hypothetical protein
LGRKAAETGPKSDDDLLGRAAFLVFENASVYDYGVRHVGSVNDFSFPHNLLEQTGLLELFVELGVKEVGKLRRELNALRKGKVFDFHRLEARLLIFGPQGWGQQPTGQKKDDPTAAHGCLHRMARRHWGRPDYNPVHPLEGNTMLR